MGTESSPSDTEDKLTLSECTNCYWGTTEYNIDFSPPHCIYVITVLDQDNSFSGFIVA